MPFLPLHVDTESVGHLEGHEKAQWDSETRSRELRPGRKTTVDVATRLSAVNRPARPSRLNRQRIGVQGIFGRHALAESSGPDDRAKC